MAGFNLLYAGDNFLRLKSLEAVGRVLRPGKFTHVTDGGSQHLASIDPTIRNLASMGLFANIDPSQVDQTFPENWIPHAISGTSPQPFRTSILHPPYN